MGQATVDLPDPLQNSGPAKSADDLLSQLAGDEIDRLLAENDSAESPLEVPVEPSLESPIESAAAVQSPVDPAHGVATVTTGGIDLDAVLETAAADRSEAAERSALHSPATPAEKDSSPQIDLGESISRLPLLLRPLEWLSAPLDPWPDQFREIMGKVGLLTLINALAVLAYVLLFRRRH